jgi:epoxyqueuosine reductase QueG
MNIIEVYQELCTKTNDYTNIIMGISDISYSEYYKSYKCAVILAVKHRKIYTLENYKEDEFEKTLSETKKYRIEIVNELCKILNKYNIEIIIPQAAQKNDKELIAPFSFKFAAVKAGIGWIGKNDLLITEKFGPRVSLDVILVNADLPTGIQIKKCMCDENCIKCVISCPYNAIKGVLWTPDTKRDEMLDYNLCNQKRSLFKLKHNRKNACGLCLVSCPLGGHNFTAFNE